MESKPANSHPWLNTILNATAIGIAGVTLAVALLNAGQIYLLRRRVRSLRD